MSFRPLLLAAAGAAAVLAFAQPAKADWDRGYRGHGGPRYERHWDRGYDRGYERPRYYGRRYAPVYAPPPVYYAPQPYYYRAPPPVYYAPPVIGYGYGLR